MTTTYSGSAPPALPCCLRWGYLEPRSGRPRRQRVALAAAAGRPRDSVAVPLGLELVDRSWLAERVGQLPGALVDAIDDGLRSVLGL